MTLDRSAFLKALSNMQNVHYNMPKIDTSAWNAVDNYKYNNTPLDVTPFLTGMKDLPMQTTAPSTGSSILGTLGTILNDTLGQPAGYVTSMADKLVKQWGKDFNGKSPWYSELGNYLNHISPSDVIGGTLADGIGAGAKQQWSDWTDGKLSWGDVPSFGFLDGMANSWKHGSDVLGDMGVQNGLGKTLGGLGVDVALDPLTYATFGASAATKFGKVAEGAKMTELAGNLGLDTTKFKNVNDFEQAARQAIQSGHADSLAKVANDTRAQYADLPNVADNMVAQAVNNHRALLNRQLEDTVSGLTDQVNAARNSAYNAHINSTALSLPFTNKIVKTGEINPKSWMYRTEVMTPKELVDSKIKEASQGDAKLQSTIENAVKKRYGVSDTGSLSKTMFTDLHDNFLAPIIDAGKKGGLPDVNVITRAVGNGVKEAIDHPEFTKLMDKFKSDNLPWKDVQKQFDSIIAQTAHDPSLRESMGSHLAEMVSDYWKNAPIKNFNKVANARKAEAMGWAAKFLKDTGHTEKYGTVLKDVHPNGNPVANMNRLDRAVSKATDKMEKSPYNKAGDFHTKIGHAVRSKNIFDARTLATGNKFLDSIAEHIADAHSQRIGETARYTREMKGVSKYLDKFSKGGGNTDQLMQHAIYLLENHAPTALGKDWLTNGASNEARELAGLIKPILDKLGNDEQAAGTLDKLRSNYFPHVVNKDVDMNAIEDFAKRNQDLNGLKSTSKFNQERQTFQTLAQRDNHIAKLEKAIQKETDPEKAQILREQQERVAKMFDTNVVSALQRRIKEGVRAKSMKAMQTKLSKYGMMKTITKGSKDSHIPNGLEEISKEEAKKLGLGEGRHYIHPEVLKGMKRVDNVFTSEGMNKFVRHMTSISDAWRPLVTYYKPSHYINNWVGNVINNMAAGIKVSDYKAAGKLLKGYKEGTLTASQMKIIDEAYKHNVISGGFLHDGQMTLKNEPPSTLDKIANAIGNNKVINKVKHTMGESADDISRLANFVNGINKYGDTAKAAKQVQTYLFNYHELTNSDRTMRVMVPFWNWMKRNIPLQMKLLMDNPKFAMNNYRVAQLFNQGQNGADYQQESGLHIPTWITNHLGAQNEYYTTNPSPIMDLTGILNPSQELGSMNPIAKSILELATNKQFFTGNPISYGSKTTLPQDVPSYLAKNLGITGNLYDMLSGKKSVSESLVNLLHSVTKVNSKNPNGG